MTCIYPHDHIQDREMKKNSTYFKKGTFVKQLVCDTFHKGAKSIWNRSEKFFQTSRQKLRFILENKMFQKIKLSKITVKINVLLNYYSEMKIIFRKFQTIFDINIRWHFFGPCHYAFLKNTFWQKIPKILISPGRNSMPE